MTDQYDEVVKLSIDIGKFTAGLADADAKISARIKYWANTPVAIVVKLDTTNLKRDMVAVTKNIQDHFLQAQAVIGSSAFKNKGDIFSSLVGDQRVLQNRLAEIKRLEIYQSAATAKALADEKAATAALLALKTSESQQRISLAHRTAQATAAAYMSQYDAQKAAEAKALADQKANSAALLAVKISESQQRISLAQRTAQATAAAYMSKYDAQKAAEAKSLADQKATDRVALESRKAASRERIRLIKEESEAGKTALLARNAAERQMEATAVAAQQRILNAKRKGIFESIAASQRQAQAEVAITRTKVEQQIALERGLAAKRLTLSLSATGVSAASTGMRIGAGIAGAAGQFQIAGAVYAAANALTMLKQVAPGAGIALSVTTGALAAAGVAAGSLAVVVAALGNAFANAAIDKELARMSTLLAPITASVAEFNSSLNMTALSATKISAAFNRDLVDVIQGFKEALSSGIQAEDLEQFAMLAGKLATSVSISMTDATSILTTFRDSYGLTVNQMSDLSDILFNMVDVGRLSIGQLQSTIGRLTPIAASAGVSINSLAVSMSLLTRQGMSTAQSTTAIAQLITSVINPTEKAKKAFKEYGIEWDMAFKGRRPGRELIEFIDEIREKTDGSAEAILRLSGGEIQAARALSGMLNASKELLDQIENGITYAGTASEASARALNNLSDNVGKVIEVFKGLSFAIGRDLLQALNSLFFGKGALDSKSWDDATRAIEGVGLVFNQVTLAVVTGVKLMYTVMSGQFSLAFGPILNGFKAINAAIRGDFVGAAEYAGKAVIAPFKAVKDTVVGVGSDLNAFYKASGVMIGNVADRINQRLADTVAASSDFSTRLKGEVNTLRSLIEERTALGESAGDAGYDAMTKKIEAATRTVQVLGSKTEEAMNQVDLAMKSATVSLEGIQVELDDMDNTMKGTVDTMGNGYIEQLLEKGDFDKAALEIGKLQEKLGALKESLTEDLSIDAEGFTKVTENIDKMSRVIDAANDKLAKATEAQIKENEKLEERFKKTSEEIGKVFQEMTFDKVRTDVDAVKKTFDDLGLAIDRNLGQGKFNSVKAEIQTAKDTLVKLTEELNRYSSQMSEDNARTTMQRIDALENFIQSKEAALTKAMEVESSKRLDVEISVQQTIREQYKESYNTFVDYQKRMAALSAEYDDRGIQLDDRGKARALRDQVQEVDAALLAATQSGATDRAEELLSRRQDLFGQLLAANHTLTQNGGGNGFKAEVTDSNGISSNATLGGFSNSNASYNNTIAGQRQSDLQTATAQWRANPNSIAAQNELNRLGVDININGGRMAMTAEDKAEVMKAIDARLSKEVRDNRLATATTTRSQFNNPGRSSVR